MRRAIYHLLIKLDLWLNGPQPGMINYKNMKLKQAKHMWEAGYIHSEIQEVTGLSSEVEFAVTTLKASPELVYAKLPKIKEGMTGDEIRRILREG